MRNSSVLAKYAAVIFSTMPRQYLPLYREGTLYNFDENVVKRLDKGDLTSIMKTRIKNIFDYIIFVPHVVMLKSEFRPFLSLKTTTGCSNALSLHDFGKS